MKGPWKEKLGGWNHKDTRRKRQKRNHTLKDNGRYFAIKEPVKSVRYESDVEYVDKTTVKHGESKNIYKVKVDKFYGDYSIRYAYYYGNLEYRYHVEWYDAYTHERIYDHGGWRKSNINILELAWQEYTHYDEPRVYESGYRNASSNTLMFVYNKPVYDWRRIRFFNDGKRRVYAQKLASSKDRRIIRDWIAKGDWDEEIPTHPISKSVAWEIS